MLPLLYITLLMQLGTPPAALPADAHKQEVALLHSAIKPDDLRNLNIWDLKLSAWRHSTGAEVVDQRTPVLVVHVWASWCGPCKQELPVWREMGPLLEAKYKGKLRIVYVAIQTGRDDMEGFLAQSRDKMPPAPWYFDLGDHVTGGLRKAMGDRFPMPVTLLLDDRRIVRQALAGAITYRRAELVESIDRLVRLVEAQPSLPKK